MDISNPTTIWAGLAIFLVAVLYSAVGHGGASGYLAVLALLQMPPQTMSSTALILNIMVAGLSAWAYVRAGHWRWNSVYPYLLGSVPAAFVGGLVHLTDSGYRQLLAVTLVLAAIRLAWPIKEKTNLQDTVSGVPLLYGLPAGVVIGLLSGMVGIGGGIFLSPLILLAGWDNAKGVSATAATFIVVNSLAGLLARQINGTLSVDACLPFILCAFIGGLLGSQLGARIIPAAGLKRLLALVLFVAAWKLI